MPTCTSSHCTAFCVIWPGWHHRTVALWNREDFDLITPVLFLLNDSSHSNTCPMVHYFLMSNRHSSITHLHVSLNKSRNLISDRQWDWGSSLTKQPTDSAQFNWCFYSVSLFWTTLTCSCVWSKLLHIHSFIHNLMTLLRNYIFIHSCWMRRRFTNLCHIEIMSFYDSLNSCLFSFAVNY